MAHACIERLDDCFEVVFTREHRALTMASTQPRDHTQADPDECVFTDSTLRLLATTKGPCLLDGHPT